MIRSKRHLDHALDELEASDSIRARAYRAYAEGDSLELRSILDGAQLIAEIDMHATCVEIVAVPVSDDDEVSAEEAAALGLEETSEEEIQAEFLQQFGLLPGEEWKLPPVVDEAEEE